MARVVSQSLRHASLSSDSSLFRLSSLIPASFSLGHRNRSTRSGKVKFVEIDLESSSLSSVSYADSEAIPSKKLEDVVQRIIVLRSTPDWLPFVPGSSFWVPPRCAKPLKMVDLFDKMPEPPIIEEPLSLSSSRGWPCYDFFSIDSGTTHSTPKRTEDQTSTEVESETDVKVQKSKDNLKHSEDEEK